MDEHTKQYYGEINKKPIVVIGVGAIGSWVAYVLTKQLYDVTIVDHDVVETKNIPNTIFLEEDVGFPKTSSFRERTYPHNVTTFQNKVQDIFGCLSLDSIMIDCVDNVDTRTFLHNYCRFEKIDLLHAGVFDGHGSILWDVNYIPVTKEKTLPKDCEIPYSVGLCLTVAGLVLDSLLKFLSTNEKVSRSVDLKHLLLTKH